MTVDQGSARPIMTNGMSRYAAGSNTATRARLNNTATRPYDRIATFADVTDPDGSCFAMIFQNHADSFRFFQPCIKTLEGVGEMFLLEEPDPVHNYLGTTQSVAVIDRCDRALPLLKHTVQAVPSLDLSSPPMGHTKFFCLHGVSTINITRAYIQQASCAGVFCDRQQELVNNQKCGCFFTNKESNVVMSMDVTLPVPPTFNTTGSRTIHRFRSWRTSQLFVHPESWKVLIANLNNDSTDRKYRDPLRSAVTKIVDHVNKAGGWTCVGWVRTGAVQDESDNTGATIANMEQDPHISYLYPTNAEQLLQSEVFNTMRFHHSAVAVSDNNTVE